MFSPAILAAAILTLAPLVAAAFFPGWVAGRAANFSAPNVPALNFPAFVRLGLPAVLCVPYTLVTYSRGIFHWDWFALYALLPVAVSILVWQARQADPGQHGNWRDYLVLAVLGLSVDLRWFERAWPPGLQIFGKFLLLDSGIYAFLALRQLEGVGFDLRLRLRDLAIGWREFAFYTPIAIPLGLSLGFLHMHASWPRVLHAVGAFVFTFFGIAVPEELFFRGWLQNLLERRWGRYPALFGTACLFGLSHFNKRTLHFNWRYVLMAALAGIFYGRAWRQERRVGASAITHATVDTVWSLWLR